MVATDNTAACLPMEQPGNVAGRLLLVVGCEHRVGRRPYVQLLDTDRDYPVLQHQAYDACDEPVIRDRVRSSYARLVALVERLTDAGSERIDEFFRYGMWLNVAAAMGVEDLSAGCEWVRAEQRDSSRRSAFDRRPRGSYRWR